ncbi:MAG: hypothetical protein K0M45_07620 [Candidatus Paracaedibacteraceae bacterium]|nr:hypothetical protein [Candidatus Paracaedibacteraceae bacterium]
MKLKYISSFLALILLFLPIDQANADGLNKIYAGLAVSWDHMGGKSYGALTTREGNNLHFSNGLSLCANRMNGYVFLGTFYNLEQVSLFISPEFQIGQGSLNSQLKNTASDPNVNLGAEFLQRRMDPKLSRQLNTSFVVRLGGKVLNSLNLYGLGGIDVSRFKYSFIVEKFEANYGRINGFQTFIKSTWKMAPVFGGGIAKEIDKVLMGLEYRLALYGPIKTARTVEQSGDREIATTKFKPYISSIMFRLSYTLGY